MGLQLQRYKCVYGISVLQTMLLQQNDSWTSAGRRVKEHHKPSGLKHLSRMTHNTLFWPSVWIIPLWLSLCLFTPSKPERHESFGFLLRIYKTTEVNNIWSKRTSSPTALSLSMNMNRSHWIMNLIVSVLYTNLLWLQKTQNLVYGHMEHCFLIFVFGVRKTWSQRTCIWIRTAWWWGWVNDDRGLIFGWTISFFLIQTDVFNENMPVCVFSVGVKSRTLPWVGFILYEITIHPLYFLNMCYRTYCQWFIHVYFYVDLVVFNQNAITWCSSEITDFSLTYEDFPNHLHKLRPCKF